jgi:hypothetical protein
MNKYEALFDEVMQQTKAGKLHWRQLRRHANSDLIFNPQTVFRQFETDFARGSSEFKLFLIEKKYDDPEHDFAYEKYVPELLVVDDEGELVTTLTDSVIERSNMIRLADMVETGSDKANKLFSAGV